MLTERKALGVNVRDTAGNPSPAPAGERGRAGEGNDSLTDAECASGPGNGLKNDAIQNHDTFDTVPRTSDDDAHFPPVIEELGALPPGSLISEVGLARMFDRHTSAIKKAIGRGELPQPCKLCGANVWVVGAIIKHLESRLDAAKKDAERFAAKVSRLST